MRQTIRQVIGRALWAIAPYARAQALRIVDFARDWESAPGLASMLDAYEDRARAAVDTPSVPTTGSIAVIPISGEIWPKANWITEIFGGTSIERLRAQFRRALADETVRAIVLRVDSPGGVVDGVPEMASEIFAAREVKPIVAFADTAMASAAYWLSAMASSISGTPSAHVGSIGVFAEHQDLSGYLEQAGVKITLVASDPRKVQGNPYEPLTSEAEADIQANVNATAGWFRADVARGRGVTAKVVRDTFGEGQVFDAATAKSKGLIDRVETFDQLVARLAGGKRRAGMAARSSAHVTRVTEASESIMASFGVGSDDAAQLEHGEESLALADAVSVATTEASMPAGSSVELQDLAAVIARDRDRIDLAIRVAAHRGCNS